METIQLVSACVATGIISTVAYRMGTLSAVGTYREKVKYVRGVYDRLDDTGNRLRSLEAQMQSVQLLAAVVTQNTEAIRNGHRQILRSIGKAGTAPDALKATLEEQLKEVLSKANRLIEEAEFQGYSVYIQNSRYINKDGKQELSITISENPRKSD